MAKKSDYSLFITFFFNSFKKQDYSLLFRPSLFTIHYFLAYYSLFIIKRGHYSLIIIPHPDPHTRTRVGKLMMFSLSYRDDHNERQTPLLRKILIGALTKDLKIISKLRHDAAAVCDYGIS